MVFGSTITWVRYSFAQPPLALLSQSRLGIAGGAGRVTIACGALALATIPIMFAGRGSWRRGAAVAAVALGLGSALLAVASLATKDAQVYDGIRTAIGQTTGHQLTESEFARLKTQLQATGFAISLGPGLYVVTAGGLLALAGGLAELADDQQDGERSGPADPAAAGDEPPPLPAPPSTPI
jgi:hypothetical protein